MTKFEELGLSPAVLSELDSAGFTQATEIQEKAIPLAMQGKDIIGSAKTGSGKTLAFGIPIIEKTSQGQKSSSIILVPTRELAQQVALEIEKFAEHKNLRVAVVFGGVDISHQINSVAYSEIIVGTPGRILDHLNRKTINLRNIKFLVLDEADRMLDMGFYEDVNKIISHCSKNRQTFLFSATISQDIDYLANKYMKHPEVVAGEIQVEEELLHQFYYDVPSHLKFSLLVHLLKQEESDLVMVFCATRRNAEYLGKMLEKQNINATVIHGGYTQSRRNSILQNFKKGNTNVLVCTDVAARGLDIKGVSHVYNFDLPKTRDEYTHRIGRTARAGEEGKAISLLTSRDYDNFRAIQKGAITDIKSIDMPLIKNIGTASPHRRHVEHPRRHSVRNHGKPYYRGKRRSY